MFVFSDACMYTLPFLLCSQDEGFRILRSRRAAGKIVFKLTPDADVVPDSAVAAASPES